MFKKTSIAILSLLTTLSINSSISFAYENPLYNPTSDIEQQMYTYDDDKKTAFYTKNSNISLLSSSDSFAPDEYEPNDNLEQAYPYSDMETHHNHPFVEGYKHSDCHVQGDVDFFWINMIKGYEYDVVLKNLWEKDRHIYIHEKLSNGIIKKTGHPDPKIGKPEHFTYIPSVTGRHYIEISGEGEPEIAYFYFAVEPVGKINPALYPEDV